MFNTNLLTWENFAMVAIIVLFALWFVNKTGIISKGE